MLEPVKANRVCHNETNLCLTSAGKSHSRLPTTSSTPHASRFELPDASFRVSSGDSQSAFRYRANRFPDFTGWSFNGLPEVNTS